MRLNEVWFQGVGPCLCIASWGSVFSSICLKNLLRVRTALLSTLTVNTSHRDKLRICLALYGDQNGVGRESRL